jgi:hypothetical protein
VPGARVDVGDALRIRARGGPGGFLVVLVSRPPTGLSALRLRLYEDEALVADLDLLQPGAQVRIQAPPGDLTLVASLSVALPEGGGVDGPLVLAVAPLA